MKYKIKYKSKRYDAHLWIDNREMTRSSEHIGKAYIFDTVDSDENAVYMGKLMTYNPRLNFIIVPVSHPLDDLIDKLEAMP